MNQTGTIQSTPRLWEAESLRLTAFPSPDEIIGEADWWKDFVGDIPEKRVAQPRIGVRLEEGPFEGGWLVLQVQQIRIDWLYRTSPESFEKEDSFFIGPFDQTLNSFLRIMQRWLKVSPPLQRLAFGAVLAQPVESRKDGYERLSAYLHSVKLDSEGSSEFHYQINRPRNSTTGIAGLRINRLSKWSSASVQRAAISLGAPAIAAQSGLAHHFCRLELDINSAEDFRYPLPKEHLPNVLQELVDLGKEISEKGDIP